MVKYVVGYFKKSLKIWDPKAGSHRTFLKGEEIPQYIMDLVAPNVLNSLLNVGHLNTSEQYELTKINYERRLQKLGSKSPKDVKEIDVEDGGYSALDKKQLMSLCKDRGLSVRGTKGDMISRLEGEDVAEPEESQDPVEADIAIEE